MSLPALLVAAFLAGLSFGGAGAWKIQAWRFDSAVLKAHQQASEDTAKIARTTFRLQEARDAEILRTGDQLADALLRLRNRPAVRLVETPAACAGASPAALSSSDGAVALRLAAEADRLRADYIACREWVSEVTR